jgi:hypothetical protein
MNFLIGCPTSQETFLKNGRQPPFPTWHPLQENDYDRLKYEV